MPKKPARRTIGQKMRGVQARIGGVGAGQDPFSKAPRTLPKGVSPRIKPKGVTTTTDRKGRRGRAFADQARAQSAAYRSKARGR